MKDSFQFPEKYWARSFGQLPKDWHFAVAGELFSDSTKTSNDRQRYPLYSLTIEDGVTPKTDRYEREFLLKDAANNEYKVVEDGQVVFNPMNLRFGAIALARVERPVMVSGYYNVLSIKDGIASSEYLIGLLRSPFFKYLYETVAIGSLNEKKRVHWSDFRKLQLPLPPLKEQEKVARILCAWDDAIETVVSLIRKKERKKIRVLEQSFAEMRAGKRFKNLVDLAEILPSNVDKKSHDGETPVRLCNYVDVYRNNKITVQLDFMEATATDAEIKKFTVRKNDVIITKDSETPQDIAIPTFVAEDIDNLVCGYHLTLIRCDSRKILGHYLYYYFLTARSKYYFFTRANGATRFGLSLDSIRECEIPIVDLNAQMKLVLALEAIEHEIELLKAYRAALQAQKQGLLQQLLTGKNRVRA